MTENNFISFLINKQQLPHYGFCISSSRAFHFVTYKFFFGEKKDFTPRFSTFWNFHGLPFDLETGSCDILGYDFSSKYVNALNKRCYGKCRSNASTPDNPLRRFYPEQQMQAIERLLHF